MVLLQDQMSLLAYIERRVGFIENTARRHRRGGLSEVTVTSEPTDNDDDVYYYICWRLKLEGETENMGVCTKERKGVSAEVLMATPCTNSLGGESGGQKLWRDVMHVM